MSNAVAIADADALIALTLEHDPNHQKAINISNSLLKKGVTVIFPVTVFPEAITSLKRAANQPKKAHLINTQLQRGDFSVEYIDEEIFLRASQIFDNAISKQHTFFDAIVAATAEKLGTNLIFSFDHFYKNMGFQMAGELKE